MIFGRLGLRFGSLLAPKMGPKTDLRAPGISGPPSFGRQKFDSRWGILYKTRHLPFYSFFVFCFFGLSKYENLILVGGFSIKPGIWFLIDFCLFNVFFIF